MSGKTKLWCGAAWLLVMFAFLALPDAPHGWGWWSAMLAGVMDRPALLVGVYLVGKAAFVVFMMYGAWALARAVAGALSPSAHH